VNPLFFDRKPGLWRADNLQSVRQDQGSAAKGHCDRRCPPAPQAAREEREGHVSLPAKGDPSRQIGSVRKAHDAAVEKAGIKDHFRLTICVTLSRCGQLPQEWIFRPSMRYVHPAEEQKRLAAGKLENFRIAGIVEAMGKSRQVATISATVQ